MYYYYYFKMHKVFQVVLIIHDQVHILAFDFKKIYQERIKNEIGILNHFIEVFDNEIHSVYRINADDKFLLIFYHLNEYLLLNISKDEALQKIQKVFTFFLYCKVENKID